jgi:allantoinase
MTVAIKGVEWILRSRRVVTPQGNVDAGVAIRGEKIASVIAPDQIPPGCPVVDVGTSVVSPGLIDTHVHVNEPGRTDWEGFETATRAAAAGGITTIVDMPLNSHPVTTSAAALETKIHAATGKLWVDCGFWGGLVPSNAESLGSLLDAGVAGVKAFLIHSGIDDFPMSTEADLRRGMPILARRRLPLLVHAEIDLPENARGPAGEPRRYATYLESRPPQMEIEAVERMVRLCRELRCPVHVVHLSAAGALDATSRARSEGLAFSVETCPHYLTLSAEEIPEGRTEFKCAPPIREKSNQEKLWEGLADGRIDSVVSDHSPCLPALKLPEAGDFLKAWGGVSSLQFALSLVWTAARKRGFKLEQLSRWMSAAPARLAGFEGCKGSIAPGHDADLVVWNPEAQFTLSPEMIHHRHSVTPYLGSSLQGEVQMTFLRGRMIYDRGELLGAPTGRPLLRGRGRLAEATGG